MNATVDLKTRPLRCLAVDDEPLALRQLCSYIEQIDFLQLAGQCLCAQEAAEIMEKEQIDVLFIDINMPDMNGLEFVNSLQDRPQIVFTTAYAEYGADAYKVGAADYLLKPFSLEDFEHSAKKIKELLHMKARAEASFVDQDRSFFFRADHRVMRVNIDDIRYIEGMNEYLKIYIENRKPLIVLLSMKKMEERLKEYGFMRIHRSYIINLKKILELNKSRVILDGDAFIPIGDLYRESFSDYINSKFIGK